MNRPLQPLHRLLRPAVLFLALGLAVAVHAADLNLEAKLIWGANDLPATVKHPLVAPDLAAGLSHNFKWTNYYEITNLTASIPLNESRDVKMSDHCVLRIRNLGNSRVAIDCIGQGKQVSKGTNTLQKWLILGGDDKNGTAWFVGLRSMEANSPTAAK